MWKQPFVYKFLVFLGAFGRPDRFGDEIARGIWQLEFPGQLSGMGRHFVPRFADGVEKFLLGHARAEVGELELQKDQAESVFEDAHFRVGGEILFQVQVLYSGDEGFGVTQITQDFGGFARVELFEFGAPLEVARSRHRVSTSGDEPAAEVLGAGGEAEGFGGIGLKPQHPVG